MAIAVIDASMVYGANRWLRGVHLDPEYPFSDAYRPEDDESLFFEFLHNLVFYDSIMLDNSSVGRLGPEIENFVARVNARARQNLIRVGDIATAHARVLDQVMRSTARRLAEVSQRGERSIDELAAIPVPWAYRTAEHPDSGKMCELAPAERLDPSLIPLALFQYRGLCYAGYANNLALKGKEAVAYVAAPGRIAALRPVLSARDADGLAFPRESYAALARDLDLPDAGYSFDFLDSFDSNLSPLTLDMSTREPRDALREVLRLRAQSSSQDVRQAWAERLFDYRDTAAVGPSYTQNIINSTIGGSLTQIQEVARPVA